MRFMDFGYLAGEDFEEIDCLGWVGWIDCQILDLEGLLVEIWLNSWESFGIGYRFDWFLVKEMWR